MLTDLSVLAIVGSVALALVGLAMVWIGRSWAAGTLPLGGKIALRTHAIRAEPDVDARRAAHRAGGTYLDRYGRIVAALAVLVVFVSLVNDIAAIVVYILALAFLVLGALVCVRKADAALR